MKAIFYIANRLREPSTLAGLGVLGVLVGLPAGSIEALSQILGGAAAIAAIVLADKK